MFAAVRHALQRDPLTWITVIAAVPRLFAAMFSGGYFAHDDHFLVIEAAQSWVDGADYNEWLPWNQRGLPHPTGHMLVYPGLHYLLLRSWAWLGFDDPALKMVLVRVLHAAWSLVTVRVGYRIIRRLAGEQAALHGGLWLALLWFAPFLGVRNLVEMVSAPLVLLASWWLIRADDEGTRSPDASGTGAGGDAQRSAIRALLIAGIFAGLAVNIRFQTVFAGAGMGLGLLLQRRWKHAILFAAGMCAPLVLLQGGIDLAIWGRPFAELTEYVRYNLANPENTGIDLPWYQYVLMLALALVPPLSLAWCAGFLRSPRPLPVWTGVVVFLLFHSIFPNKQERFILPVIPVFFVLGYSSWVRWQADSAWWKRHRTLWRTGTAFAWTLNLLLLLPLSVSFSKRERVEAMAMLREHPAIRGFIIEDSVEGEAPWMPLYYWGRWDAVKDPFTDPKADLKALVELNAPDERANAVLLIGAEKLEERVARATAAMGPLTFIGAAEPGLLDRTLHWLNPMNRNEVILLFATRDAVGSGERSAQ